MRIGFATNMSELAERRWGNEKYKKLASLGFSCIDYDMANTESFIYKFSDEEILEYTAKEKKLAKEAGVEIWQVHGPWRWPPQDLSDEDRAERMEKMKRSIYITSLLGCKYWVVHPIMPYGIEDIGSGNEQSTWDMNVEFMSELLKTAKKYGVVICFENMPMRKFSLATPQKILEFVKLLNDDSFKICLDTGHVSVFPDLSLGDEVRKLGKEIKVFHIHDNGGRTDDHRLPYYGKIDWDDFGRALKDIEFDGVFSLEATVPQKLPTPLYEDTCKLLVAFANNIIK